MAKTTTEHFYWNVPDDILAITHGGQLSQPLSPPGIQSLKGTPIAAQVGVMIRLRNEAGEPIGIGSELETLPEDGSPLRVTYTFNIMGRGSFVIYEYKSYAAKDLTALFESVQTSGKEWVGDAPIVATCGPGNNGKGIVIGGSGEFEGVGGSMFQTMNFRKITPEGSANVHNCETVSFLWPD